MLPQTAKCPYPRSLAAILKNKKRQITMRKSITTIGLFLFILVGQFSFGQNTNEKLNEAIKLMDSGKVDESIALLEDCKKFEPDRFDYPYEMAYAYYLKSDYKESIKILEKIENHKFVTDRLFQLLGNSYDNIKKPKKAIEVYERGLKKFPNSGNLYLELGVMHLEDKDMNVSLSYFEKGIEVDPTFPSNYFWASKIFCKTTEEVWGMIYGEIFMNLERNSKRTAEISKLLYDTYKNEIKFTGENSFSVSFSKNSTINISDLTNPGKLKLPFGVGVYEPTLMFSMLSTKSIDINSLDIIRSNFVDNYFQKGNDKTYPNVLFSYQKQVKDAGHIEAYNHWILMKGDEDAFGIWMNSNKEKWDKFVKWFTDNGMQIDESNKFNRMQY
jgi:tetratricopeptide (TPR) repeat protein